LDQREHGQARHEVFATVNRLVAETLGGLPPNKMHCSNLGAEALTLAIKNYQEKRPGAAAAPTQGKQEGKKHA